MLVTTEQWIVYVAIALMAGIGGQMLMGRSMSGFLVTAVLGLVAIFLATFIAKSVGAHEPLGVTIQGVAVPVLWPIVGSIAAAFAVAIFRRRPERRT